jgi:hypothetical protein
MASNIRSGYNILKSFYNEKKHRVNSTIQKYIYPKDTFFLKIWQELCLSIKEGKKLVCTGKSGRPESPTGHTQKKKDTQHVPHAGV